MLLVNKCHFIEELGRTTDLLDGKEYISDVKTDVTAEVHIEVDVAHGSLPYAVEIDSDKVSF